MLRGGQWNLLFRIWGPISSSIATIATKRLLLICLLVGLIWYWSVQSWSGIQLKIILTAEAPFKGGYVNKLNFRIWRPGIPRVIVKKPLLTQCVNLCWGVWYGGVIGPYIFENEVVSADTMNYLIAAHDYWFFTGRSYMAMVCTQLTFKKAALWAKHTTKTCFFLRETFPNHIMSWRGDHNWSPRSIQWVKYEIREAIDDTWRCGNAQFPKKDRVL